MTTADERAVMAGQWLRVVLPEWEATERAVKRDVRPVDGGYWLGGGRL